MAVIAIDLGGTKLAVALLTHGGRIAHKTLAPLEHRSGDAIAELLRSITLAVRETARQRRMQVTAVGACVPGICYPKSGRVWAPNLPGWTNYPLRRVLASAIGDRRARIAIDSDRACCILGEAWRGAARDCENAIFLSVGTGIGAGIMVDGKILRGPQGIAGSIGWLALDRPFRAEYESCGCFEYHASGEGLAKVAREIGMNNIRNSDAHGKLPSHDGRVVPESELSAAEIIAGYHRGEERPQRVVAQAIEFWGMAVANLVSLFNPQKIIFGGGVFGPAVAFLNEILLEAKKWAQPVAIGRVQLLGSELGGDATLYGAGYLALEQPEAGR